MSNNTLYKFPAESRVFIFDFSNFTEIDNGDTLASVVSVTTSGTGLTLGAGAIVGATVHVQISAGTPLTTYTIDCLVTTSSGAEIQGQGILFVLEN